MTALNNSNENIYRVGDHVFFEMVAAAPYQIRKIEELSQNSDGSVVARVAIYYRRSDLSFNLLQNLDKKLNAMEAEMQSNGVKNSDSEHNSDSELAKGVKSIPLSLLSPELQEHVKLCEVFPSAKHEILNATHIRGKCVVIALEEDVEFRADYIDKSNVFYYTRKYDPDSKTLRPIGERIHIGLKYQAEIPSLMSNEEKLKDLQRPTMEAPVFLANRLSSCAIDDYLIVASAVDLYARAHNTRTLVHDTCALTSTARALRCATKEFALTLLHENNYDIDKSASALVSGGHVHEVCDELDEWSPLETKTFAVALLKEEKCLEKIRNIYFPWKEMSDVVAFYYFWKTTHRFAEISQKQAIHKKQMKLKQVFIPVYSRVSASVLYSKSNAPSRGCDRCAVATSSNWYSWNSPPVEYKLCRSCWLYWKSYGGLPGGGTRNTNNGNSPLPVQEHPSPALTPAAPAPPPPMDNNEAAVTVLPVSSFPCGMDQCKLVFRTLSSLARHLEMVHKNQKTLELLLPNDHCKQEEIGAALDTTSSLLPSLSTAPALPVSTSLSSSSSSATSFFSFLFSLDRRGRRSLLGPWITKISRSPFKMIPTLVTCKDIWEAGVKQICANQMMSLQTTTTAEAGGGNHHAFSSSASIYNVSNQLMDRRGMEPQKSTFLQSLITTGESIVSKGVLKRPFPPYSLDTQTNGSNVEENICSVSMSAAKRMTMS